MSFSFQMEKGGILMLPSMQIFLDVRSHVKCKFHLEVMPKKEKRTGRIRQERARKIRLKRAERTKKPKREGKTKERSKRRARRTEKIRRAGRIKRAERTRKS